MCPVSPGRRAPRSCGKGSTGIVYPSMGCISVIPSRKVVPSGKGLCQPPSPSESLEDFTLGRSSSEVAGREGWPSCPGGRTGPGRVAGLRSLGALRGMAALAHGPSLHKNTAASCTSCPPKPGLAAPALPSARICPTQHPLHALFYTPTLQMRKQGLEGVLLPGC